jgi:hypothetical protein
MRALLIILIFSMIILPQFAILMVMWVENTTSSNKISQEYQ